MVSRPASSESHILRHANARSAQFRPSENLDVLIAALRALLEPAQAIVNARFVRPLGPVVVVVGCPRSGTTFLTQLLAATGAFSYPSNVLARFAYAPHIGALVQRLLFDPAFDLNGEFSGLRDIGKGFLSDVGKTSGPLELNEFFHFWRRFFPVHDPGHLDESLLEKVDIDAMRAELASIEDAFGRPFMSKAMMLQYNLAFFAKHIPELLVVHVHRDPLFNMQSIYQARLRYYGTHDIWWSVKPQEFDWLESADPDTQIAGQVFYTEKAIAQGLKEIPGHRWLSVAYEDLCARPHDFLDLLCERFVEVGNNIARDSVAQACRCGNELRLSAEILERLSSRYAELSRE